MSDTVEWLRNRVKEEYEMFGTINEQLLEAADTIETLRTGYGHAAETIDALRAENARLRARLDEFDAIQATPENQFETMLYDTITERDNLRAANALHVQQMAEFAKRAGDDMNALRAQNAKLWEALKPFAEAAEEYGISVPSHYPADEYTFKVGELRAARAAMGDE